MSAGPEQTVDLVLGSWRLRVCADQDLLADVIEVMTPLCTVETAGLGVDWTLRAERGDLPGTGEIEELWADRPALSLPHGGPQLIVAGAADGLLRLVGHYRPGTAAALLEVDHSRRLTRIVTPGAGPGRRWPDWLARLFFSSRMLAAGWRMLHASAVAIDRSALVFVAGQHGGKSTLAHRACIELGACFMADDLLLLGPDGVVAGWPTRIGLPAELAGPGMTGQEEHQVEAGVERRRLLLTPREHRAVVDHAPPLRLGAVVQVTSAAEQCDGPGTVVQAAPLDEAELEAVVARAADVPAQRLYSSDLLGLAGGPPPGRFDRPTHGWETVLAGVPAVRLTVRHLRELPRAPVWEALSAWLPGVIAR